MEGQRVKRLTLLATIFAMLAPVALFAQDAGPNSVDLSGTWRVRAEDWHFFETTKGEGDYTFFGSLLTMNAGQKRETVDWLVEAAVPVLWNLPEDAIAPAPQGLLGLGANYYQANGEETAKGIFVKQAYANFKGLGDGRTVKLG